MFESSKSSSDRREFLAHVATAAAVLAGTACAVPLAASTLQGAPGSGASHTTPFDDSWTRRVMAAKHKAVFDSPNVEDGLALTHATLVMQGYRDQFGVAEGDVVPVVVLRHFATVIAMNDALWAKYRLGEQFKIKDPATDKDALRNPFIRVSKDDKNPLVAPDASIEGLLASGAVLLACNRAAMRYAGQMAEKFHRDPEEVRAEVRAGIVPGVLLQPSGVYATIRAQDVGCSFLRST